MVELDCDSDMEDMYNSKEDSDSDSEVDNCDDGVGPRGRWKMRWNLDGRQFNRRKVLISAGSSRSQCEETKKTEYMRVKPNICAKSLNICGDFIRRKRETVGQSSVTVNKCSVWSRCLWKL